MRTGLTISIVLALLTTFTAFSLFPVAVILAHDFAGLVGAFVIGGLREIGELARKALIVDLVPAGARARGVGLHYLIRSLAITPAATRGRPPLESLTHGTVLNGWGDRRCWRPDLHFGR